MTWPAGAAIRLHRDLAAKLKTASPLRVEPQPEFGEFVLTFFSKRRLNAAVSYLRSAPGMEVQAADPLTLKARVRCTSLRPGA